MELRAARNTCPESIPDSPQSTLDIKSYFPGIMQYLSRSYTYTLTCTTVHWCVVSLKSSSRIAMIWAEIEPKRWPCWNYSAMSPQVVSEGHQQWTWGGGAVVNSQHVTPFCSEVDKLHLDTEAVCYGDAPATVLVVGVVVRVVRTCKLARVLPTDRGWAPWTNRYRG